MITNFDSSRRGFLLLTLKQDGSQIKADSFLTADAAIQTAQSQWTDGGTIIFHVVNLETDERLAVGDTIQRIGAPLTVSERKRYVLAINIARHRLDQAELVELKPITSEIINGKYPLYNPDPSPAHDYWTGFWNGLNSRLNGDYNDSYVNRLAANRFDELDCVGYEASYWLREQKFNSDQRFYPPQVRGVDSDPILWTNLKA